MREMFPANVTVLERGWLSSNNVVFTSGLTAVVDTGYATHAAQTLTLVQRALNGAPLNLIACTHLHSDHCGGNARLQTAYPEVATLIPPGQADAVQRWDEAALSYEVTGQLCERFHFDGLLKPGTAVQLGEAEWQVHAAPGHDPHSVVLFDAETHSLISADALWENGFGIIFPELDGDGGFSEVAATLDVIESLKPRQVIPGHGSPFAGNERISVAISLARSRLERFHANPRRHASHAMKVLIKFKMLEWQAISYADFLRWGLNMPYLRLVHHRFFADAVLEDWLESLTSELIHSGALRQEGATLFNT